MLHCVPVVLNYLSLLIFLITLTGIRLIQKKIVRFVLFAIRFLFYCRYFKLDLSFHICNNVFEYDK
jgi:hypothetical protein